MPKNVEELFADIPPDRLERINDGTSFLKTQIALNELRRKRQLTQSQVAQKVGISQSALSKMEHQHDMKVNTLKRLVRALGGELKLVASFPEGEVVIGQPEK